MLSELTWFRVGGPAQVLYRPADETDLAYFLKTIDPGLPVSVIGLGSNSLVRDGGLKGIVIRLARGFSQVTSEDGHSLRVGTAVLTSKWPAPPQMPASPGSLFTVAFLAALAAR